MIGPGIRIVDPRVRVIVLPTCNRCARVAPDCTCGRPKSSYYPAPKEAQ